MIREMREKLGREIDQLSHELNILLPQAIAQAVELGDLRENSEYKAALERQQFVNSFNAAEERDQLWLRPDNHTARNSPDNRRVADELDGVSQPVVTANQHSPAGERFAVPDPLKMPRQMMACFACAPPQNLIADFPCASEIAGAHVPHPCGAKLVRFVRVGGRDLLDRSVILSFQMTGEAFPSSLRNLR
jgi:hypothetical protein